MNNVLNIFQKVVNFFTTLFAKLYTPKRVVLANQEAIKKMEEIENRTTKRKIEEIERSIMELAQDLKQIIEMEKINQEFLLYVCTTNEELLNTLSEGEIATVKVSQMENAPEHDPEDEFLNSQWVTTKKRGNTVN